MKLCVDVGNTTIRLGFYQSSLLEEIIINTDINRSMDEFISSILSLCSQRNIHVEEVENIIYSSVVPNINENLKGALKHIFLKAEILDLDLSLPIKVKIDVDNPKEVGGDLIADLVGANAKYQAPILIIDLGTATKFLLLDKDHRFTSALIMPGIKVAAESLFSKAALLHEVDLSSPTNVLDSKNTNDCIKHGVLFGHLESIKGLSERFEKEIGYKLTKVITGGNGNYLISLLPSDYIKDDTLVLDGEIEILNAYLSERGKK